MNKIILSFAATFALLGSGFINAETQSFNDNFNDGDLYGWNIVYGNWEVSRKRLVNIYKVFPDNYASLHVNNSLGSYQRATVDFFWPSFNQTSYTAEMLLRYQSTGRPIDRNGYIAWVSGVGNDIQLGVTNYTVAWENIAVVHNVNPTTNAWHRLSFEVSGTGTNIRVKAWLDGELKIDALDGTGHPRDNGTIALLGGNHISTGMTYDNFHAIWSQQPTLAFNPPILQMAVIPCGNSGAHDGCGSNPKASDQLKSGKVTVLANGKVLVNLDQAKQNKTYLVLMHNWVTGGAAQAQFAGSGSICTPAVAEIAHIKTNSEGNFVGVLKDPATGNDFVFPTATAIGQSNFAFNDPDCHRTQFTTGFIVPSKP